jgi:Cdc6-like AAA superfamily ATPase
MSSLFEVEAPPPFSKFERMVQAPQTTALQLAEGDVRRLLPKPTLKKYKEVLEKLTVIFVEHGVDKLLDEYANLKNDWQDILNKRYELQKRFDIANDDERREIRAQSAILTDNARSIKADRRALNKRLAPFRKHIMLKRRIESRIVEHESALKDEQVNIENRKLMHLEANTIADAIIKTLNGMDFCFRTTIRNGNQVRERIVSVGFSRIVVTPDTLQFKIKTGSRGLFGGFINHLPRSVNIVSAMKNPNVLAQISTMIEMPVSCPQVESGKWHQGTWLFIQRNGLIDGLPKHVAYREYIQRYPNDKHDKLPIPSGVREGSWVGWEYLTENPHMLISGETGSGKTVAMMSIICTLISKHPPEDIQFIFADLKQGVALNRFKDIPHCIASINTIEALANVIGQIEQLREKRMLELERAGVQDINEYNKHHPEYKMPHIVFVLDEVGALSAKIYKEHATFIRNILEQLAMLARAGGIHLMLGVQTPSREHITPSLRDNITFKYAGKTSNVHASITAIGVGDAAHLPKHPGRFLLKSGVDLLPVQMPEITAEEIEQAIRDANSYERVPLADLSNHDMPIALPTPIKKPFSINDLIRVCVEQFDGVINYTQAHQAIQNDYDVSRNQVKKLADQLKAMTSVEWDGNTYEIVATGAGRGARQLVLITQSPIEDISHTGN